MPTVASGSLIHFGRLYASGKFSDDVSVSVGILVSRAIGVAVAGITFV